MSTEQDNAADDAQRGLVCPKCKSVFWYDDPEQRALRVGRTIQDTDAIVRHRICLNCGTRRKTTER